MLQNLISNAIKYNDKPEVKIEVSLKQDADAIEIQVCDNGPGIPDDQQERVFGLFETMNEKSKESMGIGLATVMAIVNSLEGKISLAPYQAQTGACFSISLPIVAKY